MSIVMPYKGVDISALQGTVDFTWLKNQGRSFSIFRHYIGNDGKDGMCETNILKAKDAGIAPAIYNFVYPIGITGTNHAPVLQAQLHFNSINDKSLPMAIDIEWPLPSDWNKWGCSAAQIRDWCAQYLERYAQLSGNKDILFYSFPSFIQSVGFDSSFGQYRLWLAQYGVSSPNIPAAWKDEGIYMWQNGGGELLTLPNGIKCDTNLAVDLSWFGVVEIIQPVITPIPIIEIVPSPINNVTALPIANPVPTATTSLVSKISSLSSNTTIQTIASAVFTVIKQLLHIK